MEHFYRFFRFTLVAAFVLTLSTTIKAQIIFSVAGQAYTPGMPVSGGKADTSKLSNPYAVATDDSNNLYIADAANNQIVKVSSTTGILTVIAGGSKGGFNGDSGKADTMLLNVPYGVAVDKAGNVYISDTYNARIRKINVSTGIMTTIMGNGAGPYSGDGLPATATSISNPYQLAFDTAGNLCIAAGPDYRVLKIDKTTSIVTTIAGRGIAGYYGDGMTADSAEFNAPVGLAFDKFDNMYIADQQNNRVRIVNASTGIISTFAGNGTAGYSGDRGLADSAMLYNPFSLAFDSIGNLYIADLLNNVIRKVNIHDTISTICGTGNTSEYGRQTYIMANTASLYNPTGVATDRKGNLYIADGNVNWVKEVTFGGPVITSQPPSQLYSCTGFGNKIGIGVSGTGITYQWLVDSTSGGSNLQPIPNGVNYSGVNTDTLTISAIGTYSLVFACEISGGAVYSQLVMSQTLSPPSLNYTGNYVLGSSICPNSPAVLGFADYSIGKIKPRKGKGIPYNSDFYAWSDSPGDTSLGYSTTAYMYPTHTTTYTLTVNNGGCTVDTTVTVYVYAHTLKGAVLPASPVCSGSTITLYGTGGSSYSWTDSLGSPINNGVGFALKGTMTYTLSGYDSSGCYDSNRITVVAKPVPVVTANATKDSVCLGSNVTLTGGGATSYTWSNGVTDGVAFSPAYSSVYYVTGTAANGCSATADVAITVLAQPAITGAANPTTVCSGNSVTLSGNGGVSYSWTGGVTNGVPFTPVGSGTYTVTGTDTYGCTNIAIVDVTVNPAPPIKATAFPSAAVCQGSSVSLIGSGGATYAWSGGVSNGVSFAPSSTTTYTVTGVDANGCTNKDSIKVVVDKAVVITPTVNSTLCGQNNGTASVVASSGIAPYTYSWSTNPVSTNSMVDSLAPGVYIVTVTDSAKCASTLAVSIGASTAPVLTVSTTNSNCGTVGTGSASVVVTGGTAPYRYQWNNGDTLAHDYNLKAATYIITVRDANNCSTFAPAIVSNNNGPKINVTSQANVKCYGASTGSLDISVTSGTPPYSYLWSTGATTSSISSLPAGPYQLTVVDADSCSSVMSFTISQPSPLLINTSSVKADCGVADGSAAISVSGGFGSYSYAWSNGATTSSISSVLAGVYDAIVTDANGCVDSTLIAVSNKTGPSVSLTLAANAGCGNGGLISVSATGGNPPYTYAWSNGATTTSISNVPAGNYYVNVTDSKGCTGTADTSVTEIIPPMIPLCMVTVDSNSQHNMVIWDKSASTNIDHYNVYKESTTAGVYFKVATVAYTSPATYIDTLSNPMVRSWRYKISQVDTCGNESPLSPNHKTMHLTVNQGIGNSINLIWDNYEGLSFSTYYVYKDTIPYVYTLIDSIPNTIYTYTDYHPYHTSKTALYHIAIDNPGSCTPLRTTAINYNSSKSNSGNIIFTAMQSITSLENCSVFPNPSNGRVTISMNLSQNTQNLSLEVINELGQAIFTQSYTKLGGPFTKELDLSNLAKGVYMLKITSEQGSMYKKLVLQ